MGYRELIEKGESHLKAKDAFKAYCSGGDVRRRGGAETNFTGRYNLDYFERFGFKFRLIDSQPASTELSLFGRSFKTPVLGAALSGMVDITEKPLVKVATGLKASGSMMWVGIASAEQVRGVLETGVPTVRIVKPLRDTEAMIQELREAEAGGAIAVGTDIDFFYGGKRADKVFVADAMAPKTTAEMKRLAGATRLPFIVKGVLSAQDAEKAMEIGAGGIVVSNHSGVVIDYAAHPLEVLPEIRRVVGDRIPIFVDSGIRRGSDVMKALSLGADAILAGWLLFMGLAADGSQGVTEITDIVTEELRRIMSVTGCRTLAEIDESILVRRG